jgi:hypothetical protein
VAKGRVGEAMALTDAQLRAMVRELIAAGELPNEPPVIQSSGENRWWPAGCTAQLDKRNVHGLRRIRSDRGLLLDGRASCKPPCDLRCGLEAGAIQLGLTYCAARLIKLSSRFTFRNSSLWPEPLGSEPCSLGP